MPTSMNSSGHSTLSRKSTPSQPPSTTATRPLTISELADIAYRTLIWDPEQPLKRYIGAVRQLGQESRVYMQEGNYESSFVLAVKIEKLTKELLPNRHPEWPALSAQAKAQIRQGAEKVTLQISELKGILQKRSEEHERLAKASKPAAESGSKPANPSLPVTANIAAGSSAALTLKNTVTPGVMSMSSHYNAPSPSEQWLTSQQSLQKETKTTRLKRKLGVRAKHASSSSSTPPNAGILTEPGQNIAAEDEKIQDEWTLVDEKDAERERNKPVISFSPAFPEVRAAVPAVMANTARVERDRSGRMPLPGEEGELDEPAHTSDINYVSPPWAPQHVARPASVASLASLQSFHSEQTHSSYSSSTSPYQVHSGYLPQHWAIPSLQHHHHPFYPMQSFHNQQNLFPSFPKPSAPPAPPSLPPSPNLMRSQSRLTRAHQQQQGFTPSHELPFPSFSSSTSSDTASNVSGSASHPNCSSASSSYQYPRSEQTVAYPSYLIPRSLQPPTIPSVPQQPQLSSYQAGSPHMQSYPQRTTSTQAHPQHPHLPPSYTTSHSHTQPLSPPTSSETPAIPFSTGSSRPPTFATPIPSAPPDSSNQPLRPNHDPGTTNTLVRTASLAALPAALLHSHKRGNTRSARSATTGMENLGLEERSKGSIVEEEDEQDLARTEGGQPLRNLVLPTELIAEFISLAKRNTEKGIETCGLLLGSLSHNTFSITNLMIPKQEGTPDTCTTTHEEEQFAFQDERDLMTLGWIHTHPTQSCFMSSLDLHTHASYQVMLAEAIAIVCAPRHEPGFGIFRLTDPPGLETIVKCTNSGLFHSHPDLPIYTDTDHGHVQLRAGLRFESHDLRKR